MRYKLLILLSLLACSTHASEPTFIPVFSQVLEEMRLAEEKKSEIADNFRKIKLLSHRNIALENQISAILQELSTSPEFNMDIANSNAKDIQSDVKSQQAMRSGYENIDKEIKRTWKTSK